MSCTTERSRCAAGLGSVHILTTEAVLVELLNKMSSEGPHLREKVVQLVTALEKNANLSIIPLSRIQFRAGVAYYDQYRDKAWSHTDCVSFQAMRDKGINEALTYDRHFEQAGFRAMLREEI